MAFITDFPLGDDLAIALLVLAALSVAALVAGFVVPARLRRDEDAEELDESLGSRLGGALGAAGSLLLWIGIPLAVLLYLVPGSTDQRILRSAMLLLGLLLGPLAAWRGTAVQLAALGLDAGRRRALAPRLGALTVAGALALAVLPAAITLWVLQEGASTGLVALAGGAAVSALVLRATAVPLETAAVSSAVLVGTDEHGLEAEAEDNLGAAHLRTAGMLRRGGMLSADLLALTASLAAVGLLLGIPVFATEGILVVLLGLGVALLAAGLSALIPRGADDEVGAVRFARTQAPGLLGGIGAVVAAALWLPSAYQNLRFAPVGMDTFSDTAITAEPIARSELEAQILEAITDMSQWVTATDESRGAGAFLDVLTLYTISPATVVAASLALGVLVALAVTALSGNLAARRGASVLRAARTSRTGGALGTVSGLASGAVVTAGALALVVLVAGVLSVLSAGVPGLALTLLATAGLGALIVLAGQAGSIAAASLLDRPDQERTDREGAAAATAAPRAVMLLAAVLPALAALGPVVTALQVAPRAATVWEDRALHALSPVALPVLAGLGLGVVAVLAMTAALLDAARRAGATSVVETRAATLEKRSALRLDDVLEGVRRAVAPAVLIAVLLPLVAGFGLGPAALPGYLVGVVLTAAGLGLWMLGSSAAMDGAEEVVATGRYGGAGSWGHSGALGGAVLTGVLRSAVGALALPLLLTTAAIAALATNAVIAVVTGGVDVYLRWGIAVLALIVIAVAWIIAHTAPEVDLEDGQEEMSRPLFARRGEEEDADSIDTMNWESEKGS